jgi:hypothetical protein
MSEMSPPPQLSREAIEFAGFVLHHCAEIADDNRQGELICPFAVLWNSEGRRVVAFEAETQEEAVERGWLSLEESRELGEWWAFGREGLLRTDNGALDVLLVSLWTPGHDDPFTVTQSFGRSHDGGVYLIGQPELLLGGRTGAEAVLKWDIDALWRGIESHPKGSRWSAWRQQ